MDENEPKPMTDADDAAPPANTAFEAAKPIKDAAVGFEPDAKVEPDQPRPSSEVTRFTPPTSVADATQQAKDGARGLSQQAGEHVMMFADQGKERASGALEQLSQLLTDAAGQVDDKLGGSYGDYARNAAGTVQGFADQLRERKVDDLLEDARKLVRKSPGAAIGTAAAVGFVVARLVSAGLDQREA